MTNTSTHTKYDTKHIIQSSTNKGLEMYVWFGISLFNSGSNCQAQVQIQIQSRSIPDIFQLKIR